MGVVANLLGDEPWLGSGTTTRDRVYYPGVASRRVSGTAPLTEFTGRVAVPGEFALQELRGFLWAYATTRCQVTLGVQATVPGDTISASTTVEIAADSWTLIEVDGPGIPDSAIIDAELGVSISGYTGIGEFHLHGAHLTVPNASGINEFALETWLRLPEYLRDADAQSRYKLFSFLDTALHDAGVLMGKWRAWRYIPPEERDGSEDDRVVRSLLADPDLVPTQFLPWIAQFFGTPLVDPASGSSTWQTLSALLQTWADWQEDVDPAANTPLSISSISRASNVVTATVGSHSVIVGAAAAVAGVTDSSFDGTFVVTGVTPTTISWAQTGSNASSSGGTVTASDTEWFELEALAPELIGSNVEFLRWQARTGYFGMRAGSQDALAETARQFLLDRGADVGFVRHVDGDPWKIKVLTNLADTPGSLSLGGSSADLVEWMLPAMPAGYELVHEIVENVAAYEAYSEAAFTIDVGDD